MRLIQTPFLNAGSAHPWNLVLFIRIKSSRQSCPASANASINSDSSENLLAVCSAAHVKLLREQTSSQLSNSSPKKYVVLASPTGANVGVLVTPQVRRFSLRALTNLSSIESGFLITLSQ